MMRVPSHIWGSRGATTVGNLLEHPVQHPTGLGHDEGLESLVQRAGNGDSTAFQELYATYSQRIYTYTYFRLGDREQARDAASSDVELFEAIAGELLAELGYDRAFSEISRETAARAVGCRAEWRTASRSR